MKNVAFQTYNLMMIPDSGLLFWATLYMVAPKSYTKSGEVQMDGVRKIIIGVAAERKWEFRKGLGRPHLTLFGRNS